MNCKTSEVLKKLGARIGRIPGSHLVCRREEKLRSCRLRSLRFELELYAPVFLVAAIYTGATGSSRSSFYRVAVLGVSLVSCLMLRYSIRLFQRVVRRLPFAKLFGYYLCLQRLRRQTDVTSIGDFTRRGQRRMLPRDCAFSVGGGDVVVLLRLRRIPLASDPSSVLEPLPSRL